MKRIILALSAACAVGAALLAGSAGAGQQISRPPWPLSPQRQVAIEWVGYINERDELDACERQTVPEVEGKPCGLLWPGGVHCPLFAETHGPILKKSDFRQPDEQVGALTEETPERAFVVLYPQLITRKGRGAIGLELIGGVWRVSYVRKGGNIFAPAGTVMMSKTHGELWAPACYRREWQAK
jgi:hypothetical protein